MGAYEDVKICEICFNDQSVFIADLEGGKENAAFRLSWLI